MRGKREALNNRGTPPRGFAISIIASAAIAAVPLAASGQTVITVNNLADLRTAAAESNVTVKMAPGSYTLAGNAATRSDAVDPTFLRSTFLQFTGSNSTYDLSGVTFNVASLSLKGFGTGAQNTVNLLGMTGTNDSVSGVTLNILDNNSHADEASNSVFLSGTNNTFQNATITTNGSTPYGFGDAFGKGANPNNGTPFVSHSKGSGIQVLNANGDVVNGITLNMGSFGHGIYIQRSSNITVENSSVTGQLVPSSNVINNPAYANHVPQETTYGTVMPANILISASEDGVRTYGPSTDFFHTDMVGVTNVTVDNVIVQKMRESFNVGATLGTLTVNNSQSYNSEFGFEPAANSVFTNDKGNAVNGPLVNFRDTITNANVNVQLVAGSQLNGDWPVAVLNGSNNTVNLTGSLPDGSLPADAEVMVSLAMILDNWRSTSTDPNVAPNTRTMSLINNTGVNMLLGHNAAVTVNVSGTNIVGFSVPSGGTIGGSHSIISNNGTDSVIVNSGGKLDPQGHLTFSLGTGVLNIAGAVGGTNAGALLFDLDTPTDSDEVSIATRLQIGTGVLQFNDFAFTSEAGFGPGTYTLFDGQQTITGTLGSNLSGTIAGLPATLSLTNGGTTLSLTVVPEPGAAALIGALAIALPLHRRRRLATVPF